MDMNLIITMAGKYQRFKDKGFQIPKYLLPWGSKTIVDEILTHLNKKHFFKDIYLIGNKGDSGFMPHIRRIMKHHHIPVDNLFLIDDTSGQAETGYVGVRCIQKNIKDILDECLFFHNVDTILYNRDFNSIEETLTGCHGFIDIFQSNNHNYSYVTVKKQRVVDIAEKILVSDFATSGLYGFSSTKFFLGNYKPVDKYISDVYRRMIKNGFDVRVGRLHSEKDTVVLGSPTEYMSNVFMLDYMK